MIPASRLCPAVGLLLAFRICMMLRIIRMKVLAEKHKELSQTVVSLIDLIGSEG
jgi:hypothetical protein